MKKNLLSLFLAVVMIVSMTAFSGQAKETLPAAMTTADTNTTEGGTETEAGEATEDNTVYKIGVLQLIQHPALDAANNGFFAALGDAGIKYEADQQNAFCEQANCVTIAEKLVADKSDLILAIATPAAQAIAGVTDTIPILVTAVTDPANSGLVDSNDNPGRNVSGTSDQTPVKEQIELLNKLVPDVSNVGILFNSAEYNSKIEAQIAREALDAAGISHTDYTVSRYNEIQSVVKSMIGKVDAIYIPSDYMIAASMGTVGMIAGENNLPIICGNSAMVSQGGLATYDIDYYQLGYMTGEQAIAILKNGKDVSVMPIGYLPIERCELTVNVEVAEALGIDTSSVK